MVETDVFRGVIGRDGHPRRVIGRERVGGRVRVDELRGENRGARRLDVEVRGVELPEPAEEV